MRRVVVMIVVPTVLAVALMATAVLGVFTTPPPANAAPTTCQASLGPTSETGGDGAAEAAKLDEEQLGIVNAIISIGMERGLSPRAWQIAIQAGMTESGLRNLDHGHADSLGIFQMRPSMGWGTPAQLQDVTYQVHKFYDVLLTVPNWQQIRPGEAAQAVERSAFPQRYHEWEPMAAYLISQEGGVIDATGCGFGEDVVGGSEAAQIAIDAAMQYLGTPYAWGGGTAAGPSRGIRDGGVADAHGDYRKVGFDCSGLTLYAYAQAGITLPRKSTLQYNAGAHIPVDQAQPGDLVFWAPSGNPAAIHHVAIYLGDGKILEAPQSGDVVKISDMSSRGSGLVANATRPGVPT